MEAVCEVEVASHRILEGLLQVLIRTLQIFDPSTLLVKLVRQVLYLVLQRFPGRI